MENKINGVNLFLLLLGFALITIGIRLELIYTFASHIPYWDDYGIGGFLHLYQTDGLTAGDLISAANEHRLIINRFLSLMYFELNQNQWDQKIPMVGNSILWALSGIALLKIVIQNLPLKSSIAVCILIALFWLLPIALVNTIWGVQTHTYTLVLFVILGCWWISNSPLSLKWWLGLLCLGFAPMTLAGGTFASFSVAGVFAIFAVKEQFGDRKLLLTILAASATGILGLVALLSASSGTGAGNNATLLGAAQTFALTLSWPLSSNYWPFLIFIAPILLLLAQALLDTKPPSRLVLFTLSIFGFIFLVALAVAYARGAGYGPARRYFDFLALGPIASFMALTQLRISSSVARARVFPVILGVWLVVVFAAIPHIFKTYAYTVEDQTELAPIQEKLVMSFLNTKDISFLANKPFRHSPFPKSDQLGKLLDNFNKENMLHYKMQTPAPLVIDHRASEAERDDSPFILNGTVKPSTAEHGVKLFEQDMYGSYHRGQGGVLAQGQFVSQEFHHTRDYIGIPVTGYFGFPGLTLSLRHFPSGKEHEITLNKDLNSNSAEQWHYIINELPKGYYQLVARDHSAKLWFGFATPKSVGRLSYRVERLIEQAYFVWMLGIILLLLGLRPILEQLFSNGDTPLETHS